MTVTRLSLLIFLLLVAAGYGLLATMIIREKSLSWLVGGGLIAIFAVLYVAQFLNLAGWSADYNVERWEMDRGRKLDVTYLYQLGAPAWPALHEARQQGASIAVINDVDTVGPVTRGDVDRTRFDAGHWREFSLRAWWNRWALEPAK